MLDQILGAALWLINLLLGCFSELSLRLDDLAGPLGSAGMYLLIALVGLWLAYQLLRILTLIILRILLPLAAILAALFVIVILTS